MTFNRSYTKFTITVLESDRPDCIKKY